MTFEQVPWTTATPLVTLGRVKGHTTDVYVYDPTTGQVFWFLGTGRLHLSSITLAEWKALVRNGYAIAPEVSA